MEGLFWKRNKKKIQHRKNIYEITDRFIKTIKSFGFYPTSEKVGTVQKAVYKHKSLPSNFKLEFTSIEQAQEKLKEFNIKQFTSHKPLGMLMGYPIWTATLDEFIKIIEINDKLAIEHKWKKYPHRKWQKESERV